MTFDWRLEMEIEEPGPNPVKDLRQSWTPEIVNGPKPNRLAGICRMASRGHARGAVRGTFPLTPALSLRFPSPIGWERGQG